MGVIFKKDCIGWDYETKDWSCKVYGHFNKKGEYIIDRVDYDKRKKVKKMVKKYKYICGRDKGSIVSKEVKKMNNMNYKATFTYQAAMNDFDKMCEIGYRGVIKKLMEDSLIKKIVKESNEKEEKRMRYKDIKFSEYSGIELPYKIPEWGKVLLNIKKHGGEVIFSKSDFKEFKTKKKHNFNKMCEANYNKMIKKLMKDPLIKKLVKESNEKEVKEMKYFEMKVVKVKRKKKCQHNTITWFGATDKSVICKDCGKLFGKNVDYKDFIDRSIVWQKQPKGNYVNGENIDKIKFPCFCSYVSGSGRRYCELDFINHIAGEKYYRVKELKQCFNNDDHALAIFYNKDLKKMIKMLDLKILKGKIIIYDDDMEI